MSHCAVYWGSYKKVRMKQASFSSLFVPPPRLAVHCEVRVSLAAQLCPAFINHGFVCRSQEIVKLCQNQARRQLNKKSPDSQICWGPAADPEQMLQS